MAEVRSAESAVHAEGSPRPLLRSALALGGLGSLLMWLALPPVDLWLLGWIAPLPWLLLIRRKRLAADNLAAQSQPSRTKLVGRFRNVLRESIAVRRRPYVALWWAGFAFWLATLYWLCYPHPATSIGWVALSFYLAFYIPAFIGLTRTAVHRLNVPLLVAAPVVWTGLELARAHLLTGFLMAALGHTQARWTALIQISDLAGGYAVSFLVMLVAAALAALWPTEDDVRGRTWPPILAAVVAVAATLAYGHWRLANGTTRPGPTVALIQGNIPPVWESDPERGLRIYEHYTKLTNETLNKAQHPPDLIVWPETMYRQTFVTVLEPYQGTAEEQKNINANVRSVGEHMRRMAIQFGAPLLLGVEAVDVAAEKLDYYNAAVLVDRQGRRAGRYDKMHRVMFGEYIPFAEWMPSLYRITPLPRGLVAGRRPQALPLDGVLYAPNICFESVLPHLIAGQVRALRAAGKEPDVLVNLTNDAWFRSSNELKLHLNCAIFRAIECRKPFLIAANGGITASIDSSGRVTESIGAQETGGILAQASLDSRRSPYLSFGDWPAGLCLAFCAAMGLCGMWPRGEKLV